MGTTDCIFTDEHGNGIESETRNKKGMELAYPGNYELKEPEEQIRIIAELFNLNPTHAMNFIKTLPPIGYGYPEGYFAFPKVSAVSKRYFPKISDRAKQYCEVIKLACSILHKSRGLDNNLLASITPEKLRTTERTTTFMKILEDQQPGDILIIKAQHGKIYRDEPIERVRDMYASNEFGLGIFHVICMALVHPWRYCKLAGIGSDCPGDEITPINGKGFVVAAMLFYFVEKMGLFGRPIHSHGDTGSVTGFLF